MELAHSLDPPPPDQDVDDVDLPTPDEIGVPLDVELESDEPEMESDLHFTQIILLLECLKLWWQPRRDFFASGNLTIFYKVEQLQKRRFRGPDFFVVLGTDPRPRKSWMVWREGGKYPNIIIEILSEKTKAIDRGLKKQIYQEIFRTPDYFLFDPETRELEGYRLAGSHYAPIVPGEAGRLRSEELGLLLGVHGDRLRFFTLEGALVPTPAEALEAEKHEKEQILHEKERLAAKLRELGVDPEKS
jgi:Uma2 family endonuclease